MKLKRKISIKVLAAIRKCLIFVIIVLTQSSMLIQNKFVVAKMKHETSVKAIEEFAGLKPKMYSFLVDDNSEHKKANGVNRNVVATINHDKYENVWLNNKCLRHSMNRIQRKDHRIGTHKIISLPCFEYKIYIQNNRYDELALGY